MESSTPHQLISMLYEGALLAISKAKISLIRGDVPARGKAISHAVSIISGGLRVSINMKAGGALAQDLNALYEYMAFRLIDANVKADLAMLDEVEALLRELKGAWEAIGNSAVVQDQAKATVSLRVASCYGAA